MLISLQRELIEYMVCNMQNVYFTIKYRFVLIETSVDGVSFLCNKKTILFMN